MFLGLKTHGRRSSLNRIRENQRDQTAERSRHLIRTKQTENTKLSLLFRSLNAWDHPKRGRQTRLSTIDGGSCERRPRRAGFFLHTK